LYANIEFMVSSLYKAGDEIIFVVKAKSPHCKALVEVCAITSQVANPTPGPLPLTVATTAVNGEGMIVALKQSAE
jgi:hypothetical protein